MRPWQKDAIRLFREARRHADETDNPALHHACCRTIEAMITEGGCVPSELRIYAYEIRASLQKAEESTPQTNSIKVTG